ncbi:MAG: ribbon-helix-helix protein, CopG family [Alphaproteobacteria bacterium]|nr:ribbon-helix-helix protein, CopG family [Alphaproteobacteria bacterium]
MARVTVSLADEIYRALKSAAARQHRSMGAIVEECLANGGICGHRSGGISKDIAARARATANLSSDEAMKLAVEETRRFREEQSVSKSGADAEALRR